MYASAPGKEISEICQICDWIGLYLYDLIGSGEGYGKNSIRNSFLDSSGSNRVIYMNKVGERMKEWFSLKKLKALGMDKLLIFLLIGIFLLVICIPTGSGKSTDQRNEKLAETVAETGTLEQRLQDTLEQIQGVGRVQVMITMTADTDAIEGVVVVAQGAGSPQVEQDIMETAQALFPVAAHKIKVCKMTE